MISLAQDIRKQARLQQMAYLRDQDNAILLIDNAGVRRDTGYHQR
jgi:hypothetical protein